MGQFVKLHRMIQSEELACVKAMSPVYMLEEGAQLLPKEEKATEAGDPSLPPATEKGETEAGDTGQSSVPKRRRVGSAGAGSQHGAAARA